MKFLSTPDNPTTKALVPAKIDLIFPEYGTSAPDVPHYDSEKHMYIIDQYTATSGNRYVRYVAVGRQMAVELVLGLSHSWTFMDKLFLLVPNGRRFEVVKTFDWPQATYYDLAELRQRITALATEYAIDNIGMVGGDVTEEVNRFVGEMVADLLAQDVDSQQSDNGLQILQAICAQLKVCKDFVTIE